jgi:hypothetical protein
VKVFAIAFVLGAAALTAVATEGDAAVHLDDPGLWIGLGVAALLSLAKLGRAIRERVR